MLGWLSNSAQEDPPCPIITLKKNFQRENKRCNLFKQALIHSTALNVGCLCRLIS